METLETLARAAWQQERERLAPLEVDMNRVAAIILGGGQGTRLYPLTTIRCKPAICFGGRYRLIDIPMSNSINSGCLKIYIVTQFLSSSLHQHIFKTYRLGTYSSGFIELLPAEQRHGNRLWYQGTADAVRQNVDYFVEAPVDYFLILSGDQLYNMDFRKMVAHARKTDADLTIAALPVEASRAKRMGIMKVDQNNTIVDFCEKPQTQEELDPFAFTSDTFLGSMGIYLFKREALFKLLQQDPREDFGKHLIPTQVNQGKVSAFIHESYWEDIGTIESFYHANIGMTQPIPPFDLYDEKNPIFTSHPNLPGPKIFGTQVNNSIICEGCLIEADEVTNSILGPRTVIKRGSIIRDSYIMGHDFYMPPIKTERLPEKLQIGENCIISKALIDNHVFIGNGVRLINKDKLMTYDSDGVFIRDGIIVVNRGASLPDGYVL